MRGFVQSWGRQRCKPLTYHFVTFSPVPGAEKIGETVMIPVTTFAQQSVAVFGLGASGNATALALMAGGATVAAWDDSVAGRASAEKAGIPLVDLSTADWSGFAALILAPGVPLTHPEPHWTVNKAKAAGIEVIGDIELFCRERNKLAPDAPFIAITGTNGKSTTTALIAHILREAGKDVQMGGNIGVPILALEPPALGRYHVVEMSSFQIDLTPSVNPTVGVLLNITPDHLDRHGPANDQALAMRNYAAIKERLLETAGYAVLGIDDDWCRRIADRYYGEIARRICLDMVSTERVFRSTWSLRGTEIWSPPDDPDKPFEHAIEWTFNRKIADLTGIATLRGTHNAQNAIAATVAAKLNSLTDEEVQTGLRTYPGLPHRMEEIGRVGAVLFINDSKATNADSTEKALLSFPQNVFWILGGKPKDGGIESLRPRFPGIAKAYLIGAASDEFAATLDGHVPYERCGTLDIAVATAAADAASLSSPGTGEDARRAGEGLELAPERVDQSPSSVASRHRLPSREKEAVVLLSPACASYDQFANFEKRGDAFRALVAALPGFIVRGTP